MSEGRKGALGLNATWSMAVGGMVGGGIFSVLGVVVSRAGRWAWLSFAVAGLIALATAWSYVRLVRHFQEGGGAFEFLRRVHHEELAGTLSWVLILGYVLTLSVYAFTFGHYLGYAVDAGPVVVRGAAVAVIAVLVGVNLMGITHSAVVEVVSVWGKVAILMALAAVGLWRWDPANLAAGVQEPGVTDALLGAAAVFMAYEGFQLLTYDYEDIDRPERTLPLGVLGAVASVIVIYVVVSLGAASLVGAGRIVEEREVSLAVAGRVAAGTVGMVLVSLGAVLSTASAINATLFETARLVRRVAGDGELPGFLSHIDQRGIPGRAIVVLGAAGATLAALGSLGDLVEAASLVFLVTFAVVNLVAFAQLRSWRAVHLAGAALAALSAVALGVRVAGDAPLALAGLLAVIVTAALVRRAIRSG